MTTWMMPRVHQRSDIKAWRAADFKINCHQCCQQEEQREYLPDICGVSCLCIHGLLKGHVCCCGSFQICISNHPWRVSAQQPTQLIVLRSCDWLMILWPYLCVQVCRAWPGVCDSIMSPLKSLPEQTCQCVCACKISKKQKNKNIFSLTTAPDHRRGSPRWPVIGVRVPAPTTGEQWHHRCWGSSAPQLQATFKLRLIIIDYIRQYAKHGWRGRAPQTATIRGQFGTEHPSESTDPGMHSNQ